jgi:peptidoglycan hydrolase CwlO-like protein
MNTIEECQQVIDHSQDEIARMATEIETLQLDVAELEKKLK